MKECDQTQSNCELLNAMQNICFCHRLGDDGISDGPHFDLVFVNDAFLEYWGFSDNSNFKEVVDFFNKNCSSVQWPALLDKALSGKQVSKDIFIPSRSDWFRVQCSRYNDETIITQLFNITDLKSHDTDDSDSDLLKSLTNSNFIYAIAFDRDFKIVEFNDKARAATLANSGIRLTAGMDIRDFIGESDISSFTQNTERAFNGETFIIEKSVSHGDREAFYAFEYAPIRGNSSRIEKVCLLHTNIDSLKRQEQTKEIIEYQYHLLAENASDSIWVLNRTLEIEFLSPSCERLTGHSLKELYGMSPLDLISEDDYRFLINKLEKLKEEFKEKGSQYELDTLVEVDVIHKDGHAIPVEISGKFLTDENNQLAAFQGISRDISERKKLERELRKRSKAVEQSPVSIVITDLEGNIEYANPMFLKNTGYTFEELEGENPRVLNPGDNPPEIYEDLWATISAGKTWHGEMRNQRKSGEIYFEKAVIAPITNHLGKITHYVGVKEDITLKKQATENLEKSEMRFRQMAESIDDVFWLRTDEEMLYISKAFESIWGVSCQKAYDNPDLFFEMIHPDDKETIKKSLQSNNFPDQGKYDFEYRIVRPDGDIRWVSAKSHPVENQNIKNLRAGIARDVTERHQFEEELIVARERAEAADQLKAAFLRNISHEIRTPMNAILGFSELLSMGNLKERQRSKYLNTIVDSSRKLLNIVDDIMVISRLETGNIKLNPESFRPDSVIKELYEDYKEIIPEAVAFTIPSCHTEIYLNIDKERFKAILDKLLSNAVKFTSEGSIELGCKPVNNGLRFFVQDTGIGILPKDIEVIFQPFRQLETTVNRVYEGNGLGLTIAARLAEIMGSDINVESKPGVGSLFYFDLKTSKDNSYTPRQENKQVEKLETETEKQSYYFVLIAENEETNFLLLREIISSMPKSDRIEILRAHNGLEAVEICRENPFVDVVLMDIKMPVMNGWQATKEIKTLYPGLPVIAQTALYMDSDYIKMQEAGCDNYLTKPLNRQDLIGLFEHYVFGNGGEAV